MPEAGQQQNDPGGNFSQNEKKMVLCCRSQLQDIPGLSMSVRGTQRPALAFTITFKHLIMNVYNGKSAIQQLCEGLTQPKT